MGDVKRQDEMSIRGNGVLENQQARRRLADKVSDSDQRAVIGRRNGRLSLRSDVPSAPPLR